MFRCEVVQHRIGVGNLEGIVQGIRLDEHFLYHAVTDQHGVTPGARTEALFGLLDHHVHATGKVALSVRQECHMLGLLRLFSCFHDESIVDGYAENAVYTILLEDRRQFVVAW